jgi:hypothetical protein
MQSSMRDIFRMEFDLGNASSRDPANAFLPDLYPRTTTIYSPWFTRTCPVCRQRFREGDRVRLCPGVEGKPCGQPYHDDRQYNLHCWQTHFRDGNVCKKAGFDRFAGLHLEGCGFSWSGTFPDQDPTTRLAENPAPRNEILVRQFELGLKSTWRAFGERAVLLATPGDSFIGHNCPWCRFQIRAGDHVVKCPCGRCETYFHDDIYRHLECWNQWNGSQGLHFCPTTGSRIAIEGSPEVIHA